MVDGGPTVSEKQRSIADHRFRYGTLHSSCQDVLPESSCNDNQIKETTKIYIQYFTHKSKEAYM